ncbi:amidohydrolase family protein [Bradyrhizobium sp. TM239]|uniref:amidohydrolase family protein n=1 Tax=Bradyrhizobium sp. TM239 TaxID=2599802 RepID=UPI0030C76C5D
MSCIVELSCSRVDPLEAISLDIHTHLVPVQEPSVLGSDGIAWDAASSTLTIDGHVVGAKGLFSPAALLGWLASNSVEAAYVSVPPPMYRQQLGEDAAAQWISRVNEGLISLTRVSSARLTPLPHLPIEHPDLAAEIATRAIEGGFSRFSSPAGASGRMLSDKCYDQLWRVLSDNRAFVLVHPGEAEDRRLAPFYLGNLLGNPYETTVAIAHLVFGGVVARYPHIRFCFAHGGGAAAMLAGRFEMGFHTVRPGVDRSLPGPKALMKRLMVDCVTHDPEALRLAQSVFGASHVLFGSDWPFPMGLMDPHDQLAALLPNERDAIFRGNIASVQI